MTVRMTLWNVIADEHFYGYVNIETSRVPMRDERIEDIWGATETASYNRWVVCSVVWTFKTDNDGAVRQHALVGLAPNI